MTTAPPTPSPPAPDPLTLRDRLLAATYRCVARFGLGKTTIEDVVKESGLSRATIYRQFPGGRDELLLETVGWELANYFNALADHVRDAPDLEQLLERGLGYAHRTVTEHVVLRKIDGTEILRRVERHRVTLMCGAPAVVSAVKSAGREGRVFNLVLGEPVLFVAGGFLARSKPPAPAINPTKP